MNYPDNLPTIETNSFYEPFELQATSQEIDVARDQREFLTTYTQFIYKRDGGCDVITHNYEGKL